LSFGVFQLSAHRFVQLHWGNCASIQQQFAVAIVRPDRRAQACVGQLIGILEDIGRAFPRPSSHFLGTPREVEAVE
jgi:hypothetical protein